MITKSMETNPFIILCYGNNPSTPGRFLVDGLRKIKQPVTVIHETVDFGKVNLANCLAILFIDCPSRPPIQVFNLHLTKKIPKLFWTYHGIHLLKSNLNLIKIYRVNHILMSSCLDLKKQFFGLPVDFFPLAAPDNYVQKKIFLCNRSIDISFVGNLKGNLYLERKKSLQTIKSTFPTANTIFTSGLYLKDLVNCYQNSKIVYNDSVNQTMTLRIFEGIATGALVISDSVPEQDLVLTPGQHYVRYHNAAEKLAMIDYYLKNVSQAQNIADHGHLWVKSNHLFSNRARQLMDLVHRLR